MTRRTFTIVVLTIIFFVAGCLYELTRYTCQHQTQEIELPDIHLTGDQQ